METSPQMLPHNLEAELSVIAGVLTDSHSEAMECASSLTTNHFYKRNHSILWDAILSLYRDGKEINWISTVNILKSRGHDDSVMDFHSISKLVTSFSTAAHTQDYVDILKEKYRLRKLIEISASVSNEAYRETESSDLTVRFQNEVDSIFDENSSENKLESAHAEVRRMIELRKNNDRIHGLQSGIHSFDKIHGGFQKGQYYALGGRPSTGKTAFADQVSNFLVTNGHPVLYIALESSVERMLAKMACKLAGLTYSDFAIWRKDRLNLGEMERAANLLKASPLIPVRPSTLTGLEIRNLIRKYQRTHKIELVILDYLQKVTVPARTEPRVAIADASQQVQRACVDTGVPALILVQLNRESEKEARPRMGHLKESGQIEQDADNIDLLWSEVDRNTLQTGEMLPVIMSVEKNKDGPSGLDQELYFDREKMTFRERQKHQTIKD